MRNILRSTFLILMFAILIAACDFHPSALSSQPSLRAWIDAPLDGSQLSLDPYEIVVHGSDPAGITVFEISVNDENQIVYSNSSPEDLLAMTRYTWTPPHPGDFTIQARSQNSSSAWSDPVSVSVKVVAENPTPQTLTLNPTPTPTPELALSICDPIAQAIVNATCREGPTPFHIPAAYIVEGDEAIIIGRNQDRSWWFVQIPDEEISCWVADQTVFTVCIPGELDHQPSPPYIARIIKSGSEFYWGDNPNKYIQAQIGGDSSITNARVVYRLKEKNSWQGFALTNISSDIWEGSLYSRNVDGYENISAAFIEYYLEATNKDGLTTRGELFSDIKLKEVP